MATSFTRSEELNQLYDQVMGRQDVFLFGPTGIGKSYVLNLLVDKLKGRRVCFYRSLRGIISVEQYIHEFIRELKSVASNHSNLDYQLRRFLDENPIYRFETLPQMEDWFKKLITTLEQVGLDFLFIFEDLHEWELEEDAVHLSTHFKIISQGSNCQLLLSANRLFYQNNPTKKHSPFALQAVQKSTIWANEISEWQEWAYTFTQGNTAFLLELIEYLTEASFDKSQAAHQLMQDYHPVLSKIRSRFTKLQWNLLRSIAFEEIVEQPHSFDFLVKYKLGAASSVERALKNLSDTQMILKTENGWTLSSVIYLRWLQWLYSRNAV
jgi:hypothetical protein